MQRNYFLIIIFALYLLSYTQNIQSNIFQTITGNAIFVHNIPKQAIEIFDQMKILIFYKNINQAFIANANIGEEDIRKMV